ncbi:hypothetical protein CG51_05285 [Haematobacter missouriensis]|uniref:Uncharacterized protein n=1 Tax=Haematobacter missouriensis TaxID=366616 RepID=A0A212AHW8_9RHOB|nr:hypothetical protein [Haematobacter missouriensis]KFI34295.1 hypothetical protein CG51_05285 [Haematobacter missouriensis]OWJ72398.1 hypothetical protein CDV53_17530 [Haematobacter missouriensis]OWJ81098.1 hypothetical protein CDV52_19655 [Haematobacter missouriensis]
MFARMPHLTPEARLWQSVVLVAVRDALAPANSFHAKADKISADRWIRQAGAQFRAVCIMGGIDPDFLRDRYVANRIDFDALHRVLSK